MLPRRFSALGLVFLSGACATQPEEIGAAYVSPLRFKDYDCEQLEMEAERVSQRAQELHLSLKDTADTDEAQMAVGLILLWPTLFFVEGGDDYRATEYARLKGERDAIEKTSIQKKCAIVFKSFTPPPTKEAGGSEQKPTPTTMLPTDTKSLPIAERLKELESLFKQELITKEEYDQRRKEILNEL